VFLVLIGFQIRLLCRAFLETRLIDIQPASALSGEWAHALSVRRPSALTRVVHLQGQGGESSEDINGSHA
jgi:hypothetical protein